MTAAMFTKLLKDQTYLEQVSVEELKTLIIQYPYSIHLRFFLAEKSMEIHPKSRFSFLNLASMFAHNRKAFFRSFGLKKKNLLLVS